MNAQLQRYDVYIQWNRDCDLLDLNASTQQSGACGSCTLLPLIEF